MAKIFFFFLRRNPIYIKYYINAFRVVLLSIIPFMALIFFNVKIYKQFLRKRARNRRETNSSEVIQLNGCIFVNVR